MGYISKVTAGGATHVVGAALYGTCGTAAATVAKAVTCDDFTTALADIPTGLTIHVKFTYSNTAASPTLNVNSKGAKPIYRYGTTVPGKTATASWQAGQVVSFTFVNDGTNMYWYLNDTGLVGSTMSIGSSSSWSAGTLPSLSYTAKTVASVKTWTANTPTSVTPATVVTGGTTTNVPNISKKTVVTGVTKKTVVTACTPATVVTAASGATASVSGCTLTITDGSFTTGSAASVTTGDSCTVTTGDSVTVGTPIAAYTSLTTGAACTVTAGSAASLTTEDIACDDITAWSAGTLPSLTVSSKTVVSG